MTSIKPEVSKPTPSPTPARLSGEALEKWYAHKTTPSHDKPGTSAAIVLALLGPFLAFPCFGPILIPIAAIWLVIGSGNVWVRAIVTMTVLFSLGCWQPLPIGFLFVELFVAILLTYLLTLLIHHFCAVPTRTVQFTLWEFGGLVIILAIAMAILRGLGFNKDLFQSQAEFGMFLTFGCLISAIVVMACMSVIVPRRYRSAGLYGISALLVFMVIPYLEGFALRNLPETRLFAPYLKEFANAAFNYRLGNRDADYVILVMLLTHAIGVPVAWIVTYLMEGAGAFCEVAPLEIKPDSGEDPMADPFAAD
ncbi:hypothetical protein GC197_16995 [bacterium]|nr:hypothetical protein [bacterium]